MDLMDSFNPYRQWLGIAEPQPVDHYRLLGVERFESDPQLLQARTMLRMTEVRKYQLGPQAEHALRLQQEISRAFDVLSHPQRKADYDLQLRSPPPVPTETPPPAAPQVRVAPVAALPPSAAKPREEEPAAPPLFVLRLVPWFAAGIGFFVLLMAMVQFTGGQGTLLVRIDRSVAAAARLDGEPVELRDLAQGRRVSMGMHKLEIEGPDIEPYAKEFAIHRGKLLELQVALAARPQPEPTPAASPSAETPVEPEPPPAPPPTATPVEPISQPTIAQTPASSIRPLEGSAWVGDDVYPETTFTLERGGTLSWSHAYGSFRRGSWQQTGNGLYFEQNDKFREFRGVVEGDRIEGDSWNVQGKRWKLSLRRAASAPVQSAEPTPPPPQRVSRMWLSIKNRRSIRASFESLIDGEVRLRLANPPAEVTTMPMAELAIKDKQYVKSVVGAEYFAQHKESPVAAAALTGTVWSGIENAVQRTYYFEPGGVLRYEYQGRSYRNGTWQQTGNELYFETNNKYSEFRGTIKGDVIEGDSSNVQGLKWKIHIRKH